MKGRDLILIRWAATDTNLACSLVPNAFHTMRYIMQIRRSARSHVNICLSHVRCLFSLKNGSMLDKRGTIGYSEASCTSTRSLENTNTVQHIQEVSLDVLFCIYFHSFWLISGSLFVCLRSHREMCYLIFYIVNLVSCVTHSVYDNTSCRFESFPMPSY